MMHPADRAILDQFSMCRKATLSLLAQTPEPAPSFTPTADIRTIRQAYHHIVWGQCAWMQKLLRDGKGSVQEQPNAPCAGLARLLEEARLRMLSCFLGAEEGRMPKVYQRTREGKQRTGRDLVLYLTAHEEHHRSRIMLGLWECEACKKPARGGQEARRRLASG